MASEINRLTDFVKKRPGRKTFKLIHWSSDLRKEAFIRSVQLTEPIEIYREVRGFNIKIKSCIIVMISYDLQITPRHATTRNWNILTSTQKQGMYSHFTNLPSLSKH